ncbi:MAG TPA: hypothetical protein VIM61_10905 [Chthoniobacterales bacterium]|jgi:hypothetical protein
MNPHTPGGELRLLFDWAHDSGRRLALWILAAIALHAAAFALFRISYPAPQPARISDATLYVLLPGSAEAARLAPFLAAADPALFAAERSDRLGRPDPQIPAYEPSYTAAKPEILPLPDPKTRILPPLLRDHGPVPVAEAPVARKDTPAPATRTQTIFSANLASRAPQEWPKFKFVARPGDQLAPTRFLLGVAPDGRVLHVIRDTDSRNSSLDDAASHLLMQLWFQRGPNDDIAWGTATFYWGLDVKREEPRLEDVQ